MTEEGQDFLVSDMLRHASGKGAPQLRAERRTRHRRAKRRLREVAERLLAAWDEIDDQERERPSLSPEERLEQADCDTDRLSKPIRELREALHDLRDAKR